MLKSIQQDVDSVGRVRAERPPYQQNFLAPDQDCKPNRLKKMPMVNVTQSHNLSSQANARRAGTAKSKKRSSKLKNRKAKKKKPAWAAS